MSFPNFKRFSFLRPLLEIDPRAMGLFRIIFGSICIADIGFRIPYRELMYANTGWLPNIDVISKFSANQPHPFSLMFLFNTPEAILTFFLFSIVCLIFFTLGWKTRTFQILSAICMISIHNRNGLFQNGGDTAHNLWWMWVMFLPLSQRWSVDAVLKSWREPDLSDQDLNRERRGDQNSYLSLAMLGILLNLSICYFLNSVHKTGDT